MDNEQEAELIKHLASIYDVSVDTIRHHLVRDNVAAEVFEEYLRCQEMLSQWRDKLPINLKRIEEWEGLMAQCEKELADYLKKD